MDKQVDLISREKVMQILQEHWLNGTVAHRIIAEIGNDIQHMSSVTPQEPRWIPISERLPEDYETVIASVDHGYVYPEVRYSKEDGWEWAYESGADYWTEIECDVVAWIPLPAPFEPQESEDKECQEKRQ